MSQQRKALLGKMAQVSGLTLFSRFLGVIRETLLVRYFGVGVLSDAFVMAFKIPNFFRHVFAEGALSAAFIPEFVKLVKQDKKQTANSLMTQAFLFFEGIVLCMYLFVLLKAEWVIKIIAPGFGVEQVSAAVPFLRIMFPFLLFISSSALLTGALQSVNHFFIPAAGSALINIVVISTLAACLTFNLVPKWLCVGFVVAAFIQFLSHLFAYFYFDFSFAPLTQKAKESFKAVLARFLPCFLGVSVFEINLFVSSVVASFLPKGSVSLLYYSARFMNIPLGIFAIGLSTILLPHFSRLVLYAPRRLSFYLIEVTKFVTWAIVPSMMLLMYIAHPLFTFLLGKKGTPEQMQQGAWLLALYCAGLVFLCLNKILLNMFYALKDTKSASFVSGVCAVINIVGDIVGMYFFGAAGIAAANGIAAASMTAACLYFLHTRHDFRFHIVDYARFLSRFGIQLAIGSILFWSLLQLALMVIVRFEILAFFAQGIGFCFISIGLGLALMLLMFFTRRWYGIKSYFLG
ncbi:MAG: murein biosynthesis integral membrane protein MurJ [Epsilonproteobacteria bacterium]|nr:murein biosynthesis integral membrane protein MurJ [Campylobacterota bacterium]